VKILSQKTKRISNVGYAKCTLCRRGNETDQASLSGECFVAIPTQLNVNGKWKGTNWHLYCGDCFKKLIKATGKENDKLGTTDFMNLFLDIPVTVFKEGKKTRVEFKQY